MNPKAQKTRGAPSDDPIRALKLICGLTSRRHIVRQVLGGRDTDTILAIVHQLSARTVAKAEA